MSAPRYKVWIRKADKRIGQLLLRTGSSEQLKRDVAFAGDSAIEVAKYACERERFSGRVLVKNFDTSLWYAMTVSDGEISNVEGLGIQPELEQWAWEPWSRSRSSIRP